MNEADPTRNSHSNGCVQSIVTTGLLIWLGVVPLGATVIVSSTLTGASDALRSAIVLVACAMLWIPPFLGITLWSRRKRGWSEITSTAAIVTVVAGYLLLAAAVRAILPVTPKTNLYGEGALSAGVHLALSLPYVIFAAWAAPRLAGVGPRTLSHWLTIGSGKRWEILPLVLFIAALVTVPWPLTGALGDSVTSLSLVFQAFAWILPQTLLLWGLAFTLLTASYRRSWLAALTVLLLVVLLQLGDVLPRGRWGSLWTVIYLLPLAFVLAELRARGTAILPLVVLALFYHVVPTLFTDPRDAIFQGFPEIQHLLSYGITMSATTLVGLGLWGGRKLIESRTKNGLGPPKAWRRAVMASVVLAWGLWVSLYLTLGEPGFANDGLLIVLEEQADVTNLPGAASREERIRLVREALIDVAERTQASIRAKLDELDAPYRPYYVMNIIRVDGHRWLKGRLEGLPGVAEVIINPNVRQYPYRIPLPHGNAAPVSDIQRNLKAINADDAWEQDVTGEGIVVGGQDTGYDWTHPTLRPHYRGWDGANADHNTNWHDAWSESEEPFDDGYHGTHTMGIVLGDDGESNLIGVAPDAEWIGCRNMRRGIGNPGAYAECMEFFLAPYPLGGDPFADGDVAKAPHVTNNSWGCPKVEGCRADTLRPAVEALRAAGIMMIVSAGNEGPACGTVCTPPANYDASFSVGATDDGGDLVYFSSRGPADGLIKPDIAAPGYQVRSAVPNGYARLDGTSMAGPHVAGAVALIWSADPELIGAIDETESLLCQAAEPRPVQGTCPADAGPFSNPSCACGGVNGSPNNLYGCGFLDAGGAVEMVLTE